MNEKIYDLLLSKKEKINAIEKDYGDFAELVVTALEMDIYKIIRYDLPSFGITDVDVEKIGTKCKDAYYYVDAFDDNPGIEMLNILEVCEMLGIFETVEKFISNELSILSDFETLGKMISNELGE